MTLPSPALTLTLPSLHDGTTLDCRLYHPASLAAADARAPPWRRHAAIVAHPYAPMGGCYDDAVVEVVAAQLLREGFLVGTFNFRGAGRSAGRTSWTARPERDDYASFVAFMVHYVARLDPFCEPPAGSSSFSSGTAKSRGLGESPRPVLLMCGYSYGAMVTTHLGPLDALVEPLAAPAADSDAAEIRLRAEHLAAQQNLMLGRARAEAAAAEQQTHLAVPMSPAWPPGVRVGGDEGLGARRSQEHAGHRSFSLDYAEDRLKKGVHDLLALPSRHGAGWHHVFRRPSASGPTRPKTAPSPGSRSSAPLPQPEAAQAAPPRAHPLPRAAYLMVSPLQGLVTHLATMSLVPSALRHDGSRGRRSARGDAAAHEAELVRNPSLAVFGNRDVLVPTGKLRAWAARLEGAPGSRFGALEVASAGHFWVEDGVMDEMREAVGRFARSLVQRG